MRRRDLLLALGGSVMPGVLRAQGKRDCRLGLLVLLSLPPGKDPLIDPFVASLTERGWSPGRNLHIESRATAAQQERAADMARELVAKRVDILVAVSTANAVAARQASRTIPIVMLASGYPVESGLAQTLARPGGNVTGLTVYAGSEVFAKNVAIAKELVPTLRELGVLWAYAPPAYPAVETELCLNEMRRAASALNIQLHAWLNRDQQELEKNLAEAASRPLQAVFVTSGGPQSTAEGIATVAGFCEQRRLPAVSDIAGAMFRAGAVVAHSPDFTELAVRGASFVERILNGAKPGELPIEYPTRFQVVVNAKWAKALGVVVPKSILARADRVID